MTSFRRLFTLLAITAAAVALAAAPAPAVVGGQDASPGEYPAVAEITWPVPVHRHLISSTWVLSAGHCGSVTGAAVARPPPGRLP